MQTKMSGNTGRGRRVGRAQKDRMEYFSNVPTTAAGEQRRELDKMMANPDKLIRLPNERRGGNTNPDEPEGPPDFVRFYMGSSAGAGSGEFHIYRHLRNREAERQDYMEKKANKLESDTDYEKLVSDQRNTLEAKMAKKRAKRQRKNKNKHVKKQKSDKQPEERSASEDNSSSEDENGGKKPDSGEVQANSTSVESPINFKKPKPIAQVALVNDDNVKNPSEDDQQQPADKVA